MMKSTADYDILRMRARLALSNCFRTPQALLLRVVGKGRDREMIAAAATLRKPVTVKDPKFGTLTLSRASASFEGRAVWTKRRVRLTLANDDIGSPQQSLQHARKLFAAQRTWEPAVRHRITTTLYKQWNNGWRTELDQTLSRDQFAAKPRLNSITVEPTGSICFWFDDRDLFAGHSVAVYGKVNKGVTRASIEG
jgi:hypothetical protein